jgi:putative FMN-dependent luciferase-like monooxygenase
MTKRLGLFTRLLPDRPDDAGRSGEMLYSQACEQFLLAERLGYDVAWVAQHHFDAEEGGLPSPLVFLAWMVTQTERVRLGTAIITLALEDPIRVAEDAAVLDILSGGRLELGVGTGGANALFAAFGGTPAERDERFADNFHRLRDALHGAGLDARHRPMHPGGHRLLDHLWQATFTVAGGTRAARDDCGLLLSRTQQRQEDTTLHEVQRPIVDAYLDALPADRAPRIGASRSVFVLPDGERAKELARQGVARHIDWLRRNDLPVPDVIDVNAGTPDEVIEMLAADPILAEATDLIVQVHPVDPPHADVLDSIELIAGEVAPALGWRR